MIASRGSRRLKVVGDVEAVPLFFKREYTAEASGRQMRMSELAAICDLSLSGMTPIVSRLEGRGLVERMRCEEDARGYHAVLTDAGLARLQEAWPTHLASMRRHVFDHLQGIDLAQLASALQRIAPNVKPRRH